MTVRTFFNFILDLLFEKKTSNIIEISAYQTQLTAFLRQMPCVLQTMEIYFPAAYHIDSYMVYEAFQDASWESRLHECVFVCWFLFSFIIIHVSFLFFFNKYHSPRKEVTGSMTGSMLPLLFKEAVLDRAIYIKMALTTNILSRNISLEF